MLYPTLSDPIHHLCTDRSRSPDHVTGPVQVPGSCIRDDRPRSLDHGVRGDRSRSPDHDVTGPGPRIMMPVWCRTGSGLIRMERPEVRKRIQA